MYKLVLPNALVCYHPPLLFLFVSDFFNSKMLYKYKWLVNIMGFTMKFYNSIAILFGQMNWIHINEPYRNRNKEAYNPLVGHN